MKTTDQPRYKLNKKGAPVVDKRAAHRDAEKRKAAKAAAEKRKAAEVLRVSNAAKMRAVHEAAVSAS